MARKKYFNTKQSLGEIRTVIKEDMITIKKEKRSDKKPRLFQLFVYFFLLFSAIITWRYGVKYTGVDTEFSIDSFINSTTAIGDKFFWGGFWAGFLMIILGIVVVPAVVALIVNWIRRARQKKRKEKALCLLKNDYEIINTECIKCEGVREQVKIMMDDLKA